MSRRSASQGMREHKKNAREDPIKSTLSRNENARDEKLCNRVKKDRYEGNVLLGRIQALSGTNSNGKRETKTEKRVVNWKYNRGCDCKSKRNNWGNGIMRSQKVRRKMV